MTLPYGCRILVIDERDNTNITDKKMKAQEIINTRQNGIISMGNEVAGWFAISRDGHHMITFEEGKFSRSKNGNDYAFYKNEKTFAKRVSQLIRTGS